MPQNTTIKGLKGTDSENQTRLLLFLWNLGGVNSPVKQSELNKHLTRTNERSQDYQIIYQQLAEIEAISLIKEGRSLTVTLTEKGLENLNQGLNNPEFLFVGNQVGTRVVNALLKWIREANLQPKLVSQTVKTEATKIKTYQEFETVILDTYNRLNRDYNMNDLVPIYRIRRAIGDRVSRSQFNDWLLEIQAEDILQLQGGSVEDSALDKIEDSITTKYDGLRCYARLI